MTVSDIKFTQDRVGVIADGFWGPRSTAAAKSHLKKMMPNRFPTQAQVRTNKSIFGPSGIKNGYTPPSSSFYLPFSLRLYGDKNNLINRISAHEKCSDALLSVFQRLDQAFPSQEEKEASGILNYFGVYNPRNSRGGSSRSMHAYMIAIDLDANKNGNKSHWPCSSKMSIVTMECFAKEGFLAAGAFWSRDAMHFQATSS